MSSVSRKPRSHSVTLRSPDTFVDFLLTSVGRGRRHWNSARFPAVDSRTPNWRLHLFVLERRGKLVPFSGKK